MTQWRFPDDLVDEERLEGLVQLALDRKDFGEASYFDVWSKLLAGYTVACCKVAKSQKDHWVSRATLRRYVCDTTIDALARRLSDDEPGILHRHGDVCSCLSDHDARWPSYVEFAVHNFLATNPSRAERALSTLKKREVAQLRAEALQRWWFACAYCRGRPDRLADHVSGRALTLDHVDPNTPGAVVVACKSCNSKKKDFTADEKGMTLAFCPAVPARNWEHALAEGAAAFAQADTDAVPVVMPGHGAPGAPAPTPRPRTQADPYMRARVPSPAPDPATRPGPGSDLGPDPVPDRVGPGSRPGPVPGPVSGPEPAREPAPDPVAHPAPQQRREPGALAQGREGTGDPPTAAAGGEQSKVMRWAASVLTDQPMACFEIAELILKRKPTDEQTRKVEQALARLADIDEAVKIPARAPNPVTWRRAHRPEQPP